MMKRVLIVLCLQVGLFCSCNNWLEVEPADQISKNKLFEDEVGFQNALNGVYQKLAETDLYGKVLSWGALSFMEQDYDLNYAYDYTDALMGSFEYYETGYSLPLIDNVWSGLYNAIANCNLLLKEISDESPSKFALDTIAKDLIMGEAYALRAFCHLDLIRLFAPAPAVDGQTALVPYQATYPSEVTSPLSTEETLDLVIEDLLRAKDLVAYHDTLYNINTMAYKQASRFEGVYAISGGDFYNKRGYRLNYCAIVGLLVRAYLYKGDIDNALLYAEHFYDRFYNGKKWFAFSSSSNYTTTLPYKQKKYLDECLFGFYNANLLLDVESYYSTTAYSEARLADYDGVFANDGDDWRSYLFSGDDAHYVYKYREVNNYTVDDVEGLTIPILRLSEIYYALIECNYLKGNVTESVRLLNEFRANKGCKRQITSINGVNDLYEILINDARREFVGEGQLFFMYKRLNRDIKVAGGVITATSERMVWEVPDSQNFY